MIAALAGTEERKAREGEVVQDVKHSRIDRDDDRDAGGRAGLLQGAAPVIRSR